MGARDARPDKQFGIQWIVGLLRHTEIAGSVLLSWSVFASTTDRLRFDGSPRTHCSQVFSADFYSCMLLKESGAVILMTKAISLVLSAIL